MGRAGIYLVWMEPIAWHGVGGSVSTCVVTRAHSTHFQPPCACCKVTSSQAASTLNSFADRLSYGANRDLSSNFELAIRYEDLAEHPNPFGSTSAATLGWAKIRGKANLSSELYTLPG